MNYITYDWIKPISVGSVFLGSGGGGNTNGIALLCEEILPKNLSIPLIDIEDLERSKTYAAVGLIGTPQVIDDFYCTGQEGINALEMLEQHSGTKTQGIFTLECAGVNILYPLLVAGLSQLPFVDGDSMGRALPELQMTTFHLHKQLMTPFILCDTRRKTYEFDNIDNFLLDYNVRRMLGEADNIGFFASCATKGDALKRILVPRTLSLTYNIGKIFLEHKNYKDIMDKLIDCTKNSIYGACIELFTGKIDKIESVEHKNWQSVYLKGTKNYRDSIYQILTQNENLIAYKNNTLSAMVPDLISMINLDTLLPICNSELYIGMNVAVIGTPAPLIWKTNDGLNIIGPQCFGYKSSYKSLEELYFNYYY